MFVDVDVDVTRLTKHEWRRSAGEDGVRERRIEDEGKMMNRDGVKPEDQARGRSRCTYTSMRGGWGCVESLNQTPPLGLPKPKLKSCSGTKTRIWKPRMQESGLAVVPE